MERLQKVLSAAGVASRRTAEELIQQGRVSVNGATVTALGTKADPATDEIRVDGRRIKPVQTLRYLLVYKPRGYVTTRNDPQKRKTVMDLLGSVREYVYPVGRLDYDSEGLLLVTNDGDLAAALTHPSHEVEREYRAQVAGVPDTARAGPPGARGRARRTAHGAGGRARRAGRPRRRGAIGGADAHDTRGTQPPGAADVRGGGAPGPAPDTCADWPAARRPHASGSGARPDCGRDSISQEGRERKVSTPTKIIAA